MCRNAQHCVSIFDVTLSDIAVSGRKLSKAWSVHNNVWLTDSKCEKLKLIAELLCIKHDYLKLDLFGADEVDAVIEFLCRLLLRLILFSIFYFYDIVFYFTNFMFK